MAKKAKAKALALDQFGDPLPEGARLRLAPRREIEAGGHVRIDAVRFDGETVVTYSKDSTRSWNAVTGEEVSRAEPSAPPARSIPVHGITARVAPYPDWKVVQVFRGETLLARYQSRANVKCVDVSPIEPDVVFVDWRGELTVMATETGSVRWSFQAPSRGRTLQPLTRVGYTPDGSRIAAGGHNKFLAIFDATTGDRIELVGHTRELVRLVFAPNGKLLFSQDPRATRIWNVETGEAIGVLKVFWPDAWSADGGTAATIAGTSVLLWDVASALPSKALALL